MTLNRFASRYETAATIFFSTVLLFTAINLIGFLFISLREETPAPLQDWGIKRLLRAYPGWSANDITGLLRETYSRHDQYAPFVEFREKAFSGKWVNVHRAGFRMSGNQAPWPPDPARFNIFVFGGSTTFGYGLPDALTIPSALQKRLAGSGVQPAIYNFGRSAYFSTQELILFQSLLRSGFKPQLAIFVDGLNDMWCWDGNPVYADAIETAFERPLARALRALPLTRAAVWGRRLIFGSGPPPKPADADPRAFQGVVARLRANMRSENAIGRAFGVRTVFVVQPVSRYKYDITRHFLWGAANDALSDPYVEAGYPLLASGRQEMEAEGDVLWLADMQAERRENLYVDGFHYTAAFSDDIAREVKDFILGRGLMKGGTEASQSSAPATGPAPGRGF